MGNARYIAQSLMEHFLLTEDEAYKKVVYVEAITDMQDMLSDAMWPLIDQGDLDEANKAMEEFRQELNNNLINLRAAFVGVERRHNDGSGPDSQRP